ncbi:heavy-metal-associated domain-containing protein [uncultured Agrobacterium sp.]|uniref:heavy-metal-associated domain-containing protein n=1 Tax=uncultured Agrobacterium sp. TaxID=157277 RepID=UPI00258AF86E|nr:heavy-metal-associated domain-containing protein [uncultured Agrobacterium sp.]
MTQTISTVPDMTCGHCEKTIRGALSEVLPGSEVSIDLSTHRVIVAGDADTAFAAMQEVGYSPERMG